MSTKPKYANEKPQYRMKSLINNNNNNDGMEKNLKTK